MSTIAGYSTHRLTIGQNLTTRVLDTGGNKTPLVLVHGLAASIEIWRDIIPDLAADFRVIAFDLPGFGEADKPDLDYRALPLFVPAVAGLFEAMKLKKAHLVGSSMGASLIVRFAARHGVLVDRAVMANPGGFGAYIHPFLRIPTIPILGTIMSKPQRPVTAFGVRLAIHDKTKATAALIDEADRMSRMPGAHRAFVRTLRGIANPFKVKELDIFEAEARLFNAPALIVWGQQDKIFPVTQADSVRFMMPGARVEILDGVGHYPQIDAPKNFVDLIKSHLLD